MHVICDLILLAPRLLLLLLPAPSLQSATVVVVVVVVVFEIPHYRTRETVGNIHRHLSGGFGHRHEVVVSKSKS